MKIITDEELQQILPGLSKFNFKQKFWPHAVVGHTHNVGNCVECIELLEDMATREDLVRDLIEARKQIKVLESNTCCC